MHSLIDTELLCFFTNVPCPRLQKKIRFVSQYKNVTIIYWKRSGVVFDTDLPLNVLQIPIEASFLNNKGIFRIIAFIIYFFKAVPYLLKAKESLQIYVDYIDVLVAASIIISKRSSKIVYEVGDLISLQYGGKRLINRFFKAVEKWLMKSVSAFILPSPFFWEKYYRFIYEGNYFLIENLPEKKLWKGFRQKPPDSSIVVGFIGSLRYREPLECLLSTVKQMRKAGFPIRIFLAGAGPEFEHFKKITEKLDYVTFFGPYNYYKDITYLYGKVNIIFSVYDVRISNVRIAIPNRLYESVLCGLPIIVAKRTKLHEYVQELNIGYGVDFLSKEDYRKALESHVLKDETSRRIRKSLNDIDTDRFCYEKYYGTLNELFKIR